MPARVNPALVRAYDLRGTVGTDLTAADAEALGLAYAAALALGARVAVGYDGRLSSPMLEAALVAGLVAGGLRVARIGRGPTGMLYSAVHTHDLAGGIMVTGSHNPPDQNGFKLLLGREPVFGAALADLAAGPGQPRPGGSAAPLPTDDAYCDRLLAAAEGAPRLRIGWDPGHGATAEVVLRLAERLPGEHRLVNTVIDGRFPAHHPDPSEPSNLAQLRALVRDEALDLGIAFDGDGDRIGVVDGEGAIVWADQLLLFLARDVLRDRAGAAVVGDVKSSRVLFDGIAAAGGRPVLSPSGYVLVRRAMLAAEAPLAGEMSGHIFFADRWDGTDDALHVAMRLLVALGRAGQGLAAFRRGLPRTHATPELRFACPDARKVPVLAALERDLLAEGTAIDRTDGLRVTLPGGWWLLRASGTEPKLTARVEAWTADALRAIHADLSARLRDNGLALPPIAAATEGDTDSCQEPATTPDRVQHGSPQGSHGPPPACRGGAVMSDPLRSSFAEDAHPDPGAQAQAALLLVESLIHSLLDNGALTHDQALQAIDSAHEVKAESIDAGKEPIDTLNKSLAILASMRRSIAARDPA